MTFKKIIFALLLTFVGGLLFFGAAYAHAGYLRSIPAENAIIATAPHQVEIWFKQEVFRRAGENVITVTDATGKQVGVGETTVDDNDRTHIQVQMQDDLAPGLYTVLWKNTSLEDGHSDKGEFSFTLDPQAKTTSTPIPVDAPTNTPSVATTTTEASKPAATSTPSAGGPCAAAATPIIGLVGLLIFRQHRIS